MNIKFFLSCFFLLISFLFGDFFIQKKDVKELELFLEKDKVFPNTYYFNYEIPEENQAINLKKESLQFQKKSSLFAKYYYSLYYDELMVLRKIEKKIFGEKLPILSIILNRQGNLVSIEERSNDYFQYKILFNSNFQIVEKTIDFSNLNLKEIYTYNDNSLLKKATLYKNGISFKTIVYHYLKLDAQPLNTKETLPFFKNILKRVDFYNSNQELSSYQVVNEVYLKKDNFWISNKSPLNETTNQDFFDKANYVQYITSYFNDGRILEEKKIFFKDDKIIKAIIDDNIEVDYFYDKNGFLIEEEYKSRENDQVIEHIQYSYLPILSRFGLMFLANDQQRWMENINFLQSNELNITTNFLRDFKGYISKIVKKEYNNNGELVNLSKSIIGDNFIVLKFKDNQLQEKQVFNKSRQLLGSYHYKYYSNGLLESNTFFDRKKDKSFKTKYFYNVSKFEENNLFDKNRNKLFKELLPMFVEFQSTNLNFLGESIFSTVLNKLVKSKQDLQDLSLKDKFFALRELSNKKDKPESFKEKLLLKKLEYIQFSGMTKVIFYDHKDLAIKYVRIDQKSLAERKQMSFYSYYGIDFYYKKGSLDYYRSNELIEFSEEKIRNYLRSKNDQQDEFNEVAIDNLSNEHIENLNNIVRIDYKSGLLPRVVIFEKYKKDNNLKTGEFFINGIEFKYNIYHNSFKYLLEKYDLRKL